MEWRGGGAGWRVDGTGEGEEGSGCRGGAGEEGGGQSGVARTGGWRTTGGSTSSSGEPSPQRARTTTPPAITLTPPLLPSSQEEEEFVAAGMDFEAENQGIVESGHAQGPVPAEANKLKITTPYMTKYEKARILGTRALQIRCAISFSISLRGKEGGS